MTIAEFINHYKVTFFSARTCLNFSHFLRQVKRALPFNFALERDSKNIFCYQHDIENYADQVLNFLLTVRHEYIYTLNLPVCNSGQYSYVTDLCNFFFVLQDLIDRIDYYFQRIAFQRNFLLASNTLHQKVFPM